MLDDRHPCGKQITACRDDERQVWVEPERVRACRIRPGDEQESVPIEVVAAGLSHARDGGAPGTRRIRLQQ